MLSKREKSKLRYENILGSQMWKDYLVLLHTLYVNRKNSIDYNINCDFDIIYFRFWFDLGYSFYDLKECDKLYASTRGRYHRLHKRITKILTNCRTCFFLTFTFNDYFLNNVSKETRRTYVRRFLKSISNNYVANIDFGSSDDYFNSYGILCTATNREHYHAIVGCDFIDSHFWKCGILNFKTIYSTSTDCEKLSHYVAKFCNHSLKSSTHYESLIYSRS